MRVISDIFLPIGIVLGNKQLSALYQESHSPEEYRNSLSLTLSSLELGSVECLDENLTVSFLNLVKLG